ncbi:MAG: hypothetical protein JW730_22700 [Anaerolineales bacterium]|nr:hypothetical protein [Anaerolineales bacterium]
MGANVDNSDEIFATAYKEGKLLEVIHKQVRENRDDLDSLIAELTRLHNHGDIDLIISFSLLKNEPNSQPDFFLMRRVLEKSLPALDAPIAETMSCVINLVKEAGQDMAAGMVLPPFIDYCAANHLRPKEAIQLIETFPEKFANLLPQVIIAGTRLDIELYLGEAIRFSNHSVIEIRRSSIFSLGGINYLEDERLIDKAIFCLEASVSRETDDLLLGHLINSTFNLWKQTKRYIERITHIVDKALSQGDNYALHSGAVAFGFDTKELPDILLDCLLSHLIRIKPENKGSLEYIDYGLAEIIANGNWRGVNFLENLLLANSEKLTIDTFDSVMHECFKNQNSILSRIMTKWFIKGDRILCEAVRTIAGLAHENNIQLEVEQSEIDCSTSILVIFLARKAVGYLFPTPVTAASIIVSLIRCTSDNEIIQILVDLLFEPLLINYPGMVKDYLIKKSYDETDKVKESLERALKNFDDYLGEIKSVGIIPELHPPQSQQEAYHRHFSQLMADAMENARKDSVLLSLVSTSVLLYGRKSVDYVYNSDGQSNRMEIPLQVHSTELEFPRLVNIDPFGLDYMLRVFRAEQVNL